MSEAARVDLTIDQGSDFALQLYWTNSFDVPYQVTHPIRMQVKDSVAQTVLEFVSGSEEEGEYEDHELTFNSELGLIQLTATAAKTSTLSPGVYFYDMFATYIDDRASDEEGSQASKPRLMKIMRGTVKVNGRITADV